MENWIIMFFIEDNSLEERLVHDKKKSKYPHHNVYYHNSLLKISVSKSSIFSLLI